MREFDYAAPKSLQEAIDLLSRLNGQARPLAGGTDLIAQMKENRRSPALVVDVKRIPELNVLSFDEKQGLRLGAAVSCMRIANFPAAREKYVALADACGLIGSVQIQNRAAVRRQFLQCDAFGRYGTTDHFVWWERTDRRAQWPPRVAGGGFFCRPGTNCARKRRDPRGNHYSNAVPSLGRSLPALHSSRRNGYRSGRRGILVRFSADGLRCDQARITLAAVAPTAVRAREAEEFLAGKSPDETTFAQAGELAARSAKPISDVRGSAAYRIELIKVLTRRSLLQAWARAQQASC